MSMLKYFFEIGSDNMLSDNNTLFDGLEISNEKELCHEYMGKFPAISVTLKEATGENFTDAKAMLRNLIGKEAMRFQFLMQSEHMTEPERKRYEARQSVPVRILRFHGRIDQSPGQTLALFCLIPRHITPIVAKIQPQQTNPYQHSLNWMSR